MKKHKDRLVIGCDLDGIIANLHAAWLDWYNKKWHDNLPLSKLQWDLKGIVKKECGDAVYDYLRDVHIYENVQPIDGAVEGVKKLISDGHDFVIITHAAGGSKTIPDKAKWISTYLPDVKEDNVIYCSRKELVKVDVFIDDSPNNIIKYRKAWPKAHILAIAWPYNKSAEDKLDLRASSYRRTDRAWDRMLEYIEGL